MSKRTLPNPGVLAAAVADLVNAADAELAGYRLTADAPTYTGRIDVRLRDRSGRVITTYTEWLD